MKINFNSSRLAANPRSIFIPACLSFLKRSKIHLHFPIKIQGVGILGDIYGNQMAGGAKP
jgi:hypothetical protein